ncbi:MAG: putative sulfate/molybdate transporter [Methanoregula sp.]|nr:MAG: putative sulfate/molybdate transporter [Methanoregula sp.]
MTEEERPALKFSLSELAGAFGDFGTIIPLIVAVALVTTMNIGAMLLFFGIWYMITGYYYGLPIPIEPMKAIAVIVIAERLGAGEIAAAGLILGVLFLLMSYGPLLRWLEAAIPTSVVRGIQLGLALLLVRTSVGFIISDPLFSAIGIMIILLFLIIIFYQERIPDLSALIIIAIGVAAGIIINGLPQVQVLTFQALIIPPPADYIDAMYSLVPAQALLTVTNAILATALLTKDLFKREVPAPHLSRSIGIMNLISVPLGGFPMCHGAGGLAGQYRYGARTGGANILAGLIFIVLALFFASADMLTLIPVGLFGALLLFVALEMGKHSFRTESLPVTILIGVLALISSMTVAFFIGIIAAYLVHKSGFAKIPGSGQ